MHYQRGVTPLLLAASSGVAEAAVMLIKYGANIDSQNIVSIVSNQQMVHVPHRSNLLSNMYQDGETPLHAASHGYTETVEALIKHGAIVDFINKVSAVSFGTDKR